jgi:hypothetical protein
VCCKFFIEFPIKLLLTKERTHACPYFPEHGHSFPPTRTGSEETLRRMEATANSGPGAGGGVWACKNKAPITNKSPRVKFIMFLSDSDLA